MSTQRRKRGRKSQSKTRKGPHLQMMEAVRQYWAGTPGKPKTAQSTATAASTA